MSHEASEGQEVQAGEGLRPPLVVLRQPAAARRPGEGALGHPAPGQEHEAAPGLGVLDHLEAEAIRRGVGRGFVAGVALVDEGELDRRAGRPLDGRPASPPTCARSCARPPA